MVENTVVSAVISLENIKKMRSVVYEYSEKQVETTLEDILGTSPAMVEQKKYAAKLSETDSTVLILGESGTGKELFARAIHSAGKRSGFPFITINCAAIPETLLESELFGYEDGAFSGARKGGKPGKFEIAAGPPSFWMKSEICRCTCRPSFFGSFRTRVWNESAGTIQILWMSG